MICLNCGQVFSKPDRRILYCSKSCAAELRERRRRDPNWTPDYPERRRQAWNRWHGMILRCTNPAHASWRDYGARGIRVCQRWLDSFDAYYADTGDRPGPQYTLDRIDNDGDYEPGNVRWATWSQQNNNTRRKTGSARTHCIHGHELDERNTYVDISRGTRSCRTCRNERTRAYYARKRAEKETAS